MISREEFVKLKSGDLVVWKNKYLRTVLKGPADCFTDGRYSALSIEFSIRRKSWTTRAYTVYCYNDIKNHISLANKSIRSLILKSEWKTLELIGFDVRKEIDREIEFNEGVARRTGNKLCKAYPRIKNLVRKKKFCPV